MLLIRFGQQLNNNKYQYGLLFIINFKYHNIKLWSAVSPPKQASE